MCAGATLHRRTCIGDWTMIRVIALLCELDVPDRCVERVHDFVPRLPIACIFAAGPELERLTPEGWTVVRVRCTTASNPGGR